MGGRLEVESRTARADVSSSPCRCPCSPSTPPNRAARPASSPATTAAGGACSSSTTSRPTATCSAICSRRSASKSPRPQTATEALARVRRASSRSGVPRFAHAGHRRARARAAAAPPRATVLRRSAQRRPRQSGQAKLKIIAMSASVLVVQSRGRVCGGLRRFPAQAVSRGRPARAARPRAPPRMDWATARAPRHAESPSHRFWSPRGCHRSNSANCWPSPSAAKLLRCGSGSMRCAATRSPTSCTATRKAIGWKKSVSCSKKKSWRASPLSNHHSGRPAD